LPLSGRFAGATLTDNTLQTATVSGDRQNVDIWVEVQAPSVILAQMQPGSAFTRAGTYAGGGSIACPIGDLLHESVAHGAC